MRDKNLRDVSETLQKLEVRHFLAHGTLLGLVREGDFLPWDKDIDFALFDPGDKELLALQRSLEESGFSVHAGNHAMKCYRTQGMTVDLNFYFPVSAEATGKDKSSIWRRIFIVPDGPRTVLLLQTKVKAIRAYVRDGKEPTSAIKRILLGLFSYFPSIRDRTFSFFEWLLKLKISEKEACYELPDSLVRFRLIELEDHDVVVPEEPELVLATTYGADWQTPRRSPFWWGFTKSVQ